MGSNGAYIPNRNGTAISAFGLHLLIPPGTGGGCVTTGPFKNHTTNLGPVAYAPQGPNGGLGYNPRCLVRDLSPGFSNQTKPSDVAKVIREPQDLYSFDDLLEGLTGVHAGAHFLMGGVGIDAFASPGDPAFYLHHAQVDRVWTIWQALKPEERLNQVYGTGTAFNSEFLFFASLLFPSAFLFYCYAGFVSLNLQAAFLLTWRWQHRHLRILRSIRKSISTSWLRRRRSAS